jgi:hypothetical protein
VEDGGYPKQKTQNDVKDCALRRVGFQINSERRQQNRDDYEQQFIHIVERTGRPILWQTDFEADFEAAG